MATMNRLSSHLLAIDPGCTESAYVVIDQECRPLWFDKTENYNLLGLLADAQTRDDWQAGSLAVEMVASYGMPVGAEVFETCVWIGRFWEVGSQIGMRCERVKRQPVKLHHCHSSKANDATVRQALVDRFAMGHRNYGKGTKANPGWFYGFRADVWQAYALAVYAMDQRIAIGGDAA